MVKTITRSKSHYLLMMVITMIYLVVTAFFEEGVAYFDPIYTTLMSNAEFYLTFSLCVVLFTIVVFISKHYLFIKINWPFAFLAFFLFFIDLIAIFLFPEWTVFTGVYHLTVELRFRYLAFWIAACLAFYVFFAIMPKSVINVRAWNVYFLGGLFITLVACVYSYIKEFGTYASFFNTNISFRSYEGTVSFANNRNTFATLLLVGTICSCYLFSSNRNCLFLFFAFLFWINILFTLSRTSFVCESVFLFSFLIYDYVITVKSKPILKTFCVILFILFCCSPIVIIKTNIFPESFVSKILNAYFSRLFNFSDPRSLESLDARTSVWSLELSLCSESFLRVLFGMGDWNFSWFLGFARSGSYQYIESSHSGFIDVFCRLGLLGSLVYIGLFVYFFLLILQNIKRKAGKNFLQIIILITVFLHGFFEDTNLLNMQAKDMMFLFLVFMPVLTNFALSKEQIKQSNWEFEYSSANKNTQKIAFSPLDWMRFSYFLTASLVFIVVGLSKFYAVWQNFIIVDTLPFQLNVSLIIIFIPPIVFLSCCKKEKKEICRFFILAILGLAFSSSCFICAFYSNSYVSFIILLIAGFGIVLFGSAGLGKAWLSRILFPSIIYLTATVFSVAINKISISYFLIPNEIFQPYAKMCLIILDFLVLFAAVLVDDTTTNEKKNMFSKWLRLEDCYRFMLYRYCVKYGIRQMKSWQRKPVLKNQN
jgi:hypothetical protein